jgi:hypothetical protein
MIYRGPDYLDVILFGSYPTPSPLYRQYLRLSTHRKTKSEPEGQLADEVGDGIGEWTNHTTARKPGPL